MVGDMILSKRGPVAPKKSPVTNTPCDATPARQISRKYSISNQCMNDLLLNLPLNLQIDLHGDEPAPAVDFLAPI